MGIARDMTGVVRHSAPHTRGHRFRPCMVAGFSRLAAFGVVGLFSIRNVVQGPQHVFARLFAPAAGICTHLAMLVLIRMVLTVCFAGLTGFETALNLSPDSRRCRSPYSRKNSSRRIAGVYTVEVRSN